ncbi:MAG TPA: twin-arginine translocase TatA/TatE family subunit [Candidatus Binataceae bacterium]|nr:twin-arginine translocase TatA/TatE family subunit [Candidatus Binataceae bacterium]
MGLFEIIIILAVALIVLGPERMPEVVRLAVQILREVRTAASEAMREITEAMEQEKPPTPPPAEPPSPAVEYQPPPSSDKDPSDKDPSHKDPT